MDRAQILAHQYDRVPRYTSYPTAPHFGPAAGDGAYAARLAEGFAEPLSLYLHVPYCRTLCWYCGCHTRATKVDTPVLRYAEALALEIDRVAEHIGHRAEVGHIHWGGGTPTILAVDTFTAFMAQIDRAFRRTATCEAAIEIDPRVFTDAHAAAFREAGISRVSLGVQSLDERVQAAINRIQPLADTVRAIEALRAAGIGEINLDLVYGLPHQTVASVAATVDGIADLRPGRIAVFGYAHLPRLKRHQRLIDPAALPGGAERLDQALAVHDRLVHHGYIPIGLDHYALPSDGLAEAASAGRLRRNFQGYTTDACPTLLGFGASAIGAFDDLYVQNTPDIPAYLAQVADGRLPIARVCALDAEDRLRRRVIEALMCTLGVDIAAEAAEFGVPAEHFAEEVARLEVFRRRGIVSVEGWRVSVAEDYRLLVRSVAAVFDTYLAPTEQLHATAV
ncbi:MAG: oxygen-independent coproporphyrinogen III oxidase [Rhodospirillaceae bacterium]|nr:oxygen-independent coproporphyrinogen III oxidase [Rhodospirillaceae bacterium]